MKIFKFVFVILVFIFVQSYSQQSIDYSDPKDVAEKFLDYFFKGQFFDATKYCGAEDCQRQIEILMTKMALDDSYIEEGNCTFKIDSVKISKDLKSAKCFYTKTCSKVNKPINNHLDMIKSNDKWLVEYIYKRDKYL
jgi:ribosome-binding factor A